MNNSGSYIESEIINSYRKFLKVFLRERDAQKLRSFFSAGITNIGTSINEFTTDPQRVYEIFKEDITQCPSPVGYDEQSISVEILSESSALLLASFDIEYSFNDIPLPVKNYRLSMLWKKQSSEWLIHHIHLSRGEALKEGESYPLSDIEDRNQVLEALVNERTRDLGKLSLHLADAIKEINEVKERFETIFEKVSDGIIVADWKQKKFYMINQRFCSLLGYKKNEMDPIWFDDLIPQEYLQESYEKLLQESNGDRILAEDIPMMGSNNEIRYFDITSQPIRIKRKTYLVSLCRDITLYKKSLQQKYQAEIARKASEEKNTFLANMSHEIRTPLTGIMGMSEILSKTRLSARQAEYVNIIHDSSQVLLTLINDILDITRIEAGKMTLKREKFVFEELLHNIQILTHESLINTSNKLEIIIEDAFPAMLYTDKIRMEQVIMNLLTNAIKFTRNGTITLHMGHLESVQKNMYKISVKDTGVGISAQHQAKLFQKYQQVDNSLTRAADGSGLGLFICRKLVTLMGGNIGVNSILGQGSTFWFTFKSMPVPGNKSSLVNTDMETQKSLRLKVLLVDDKKINLQVITLMLHSAGCDVETAANGQEALDKFDPDKHDVILMDIMMPLMDGITAMKHLKARYDKAMKPVIAITANAMAGDRDKYLAEGFDAYITKPITMQKLRAELEDAGLFKN